MNCCDSLDRPVVDVGEEVGLLLLAVPLPHQQLLHCRQGQAHHDLYFSGIISLGAATKNYQKKLFLLKMSEFPLTNP